jgi:hypothetical protein
MKKWTAARLSARNSKIIEILSQDDWRKIKSIATGQTALASDRVMEIGFHKMRVAHTGVPEKLKNESRQWLAVRGLGDMHGNPIYPAGGRA